MREGLSAVYPRLWRFSMSLTRDRALADDLAQTTCLRALDKASAFTPGTRLEAWIMTMAHRVWLNEVRARAVRQGTGVVRVEDADLPDGAPDATENIFAGEVLSEVMALPEAQRTVVMLVYVEGFKYAEAADALDVPIGTIMSRLAAARGRLKEKLPRDVAAE